MKIEPYLFFDGRCEEAIDYYTKSLGAKVEMVMRFKESPDQSNVTPEMRDKVMHASVTIGDNRVMLSDGHCSGSTNFQGFSLSITVADEAEAEKVFNALSDGGQVQLPLTETFFSPRFGMTSDRFGIGWMVMVQPKQ